jgi:hypothetical protein
MTARPVAGQPTQLKCTPIGLQALRRYKEAIFSFQIFGGSL